MHEQATATIRVRRAEEAIKTIKTIKKEGDCAMSRQPLQGPQRTEEAPSTNSVRPHPRPDQGTGTAAARVGRETSRHCSAKVFFFRPKGRIFVREETRTPNGTVNWIRSRARPNKWAGEGGGASGIRGTVDWGKGNRKCFFYFSYRRVSGSVEGALSDAGEEAKQEFLLARRRRGRGLQRRALGRRGHVYQQCSVATYWFRLKKSKKMTWIPKREIHQSNEIEAERTSQLDLPGLGGFYRVSLSVEGFYWVLLGFGRFYQISMGITRFGWVLMGSTGY